MAMTTTKEPINISKNRSIMGGGLLDFAVGCFEVERCLRVVRYILRGLQGRENLG